MGGSSVTKVTAQCHAEPGDLCSAVRAVRQRATGALPPRGLCYAGVALRVR